MNLEKIDYTDLEIIKRTFTFKESVSEYPDFEKHYLFIVNNILNKTDTSADIVSEYRNYKSDNGLDFDLLQIISDIKDEVLELRQVYSKGFLVVYLNRDFNIVRASEKTFVSQKDADKYIQENKETFKLFELFKIALI